MKLLNICKKDNSVQDYILWYLKRYWRKVTSDFIYEYNLAVLDSLLNTLQKNNKIVNWSYTKQSNNKVHILVTLKHTKNITIETKMS